MARRPSPDDLLDKRAAAEILGVSVRTLERIMDARQIEHVRVGQTSYLVRIRRSAIDDYLRRQTVEVLIG